MREWKERMKKSAGNHIIGNFSLWKINGMNISEKIYCKENKNKQSITVKSFYFIRFKSFTVSFPDFIIFTSSTWISIRSLVFFWKKRKIEEYVTFIDTYSFLVDFEVFMREIDTRNALKFFSSSHWFSASIFFRKVRFLLHFF